MSEHKFIYKILTNDQWQQMQNDKVLLGAPIDLQDGFIHFSTKDQVAETLDKHFNGQVALRLLEVEAANVASDLKWETSRNNDLFPHLYASLPLESVTQEWGIRLVDGVHQLPADLR